jgi:ribosomal protein S18 acetylase RimI-like enzyme
MRDMLPKLFFVHFRDTSFVPSATGSWPVSSSASSPSPKPNEAYVHFVGVSPNERGAGLGRELYERFFTVARARGRRVSCVTSPANARSLAFHKAIGFEPGRPQADYDGPGEDRVVLTRSLDTPRAATETMR